tara:strand:- start:1023 stop:1193 length:171 start_codon:yes stop_codon:yes gene_type:complete
LIFDFGYPEDLEEEKQDFGMVKLIEVGGRKNYGGGERVQLKNFRRSYIYYYRNRKN